MLRTPLLASIASIASIAPVACAAFVALLALPACDLLLLAECQADGDCNGDDVCVDGTCVECENDNDCDDDEECDDGDCESVSEGEGEAGEGEGDEGEGEEGEGDEGEGEEGEGEGEEGEGEGDGFACLNTGDCPIDDFCSSSSGECEPLTGDFCRIDAQCDAPTDVCSALSEDVPGECVECVIDDDCGDGGNCEESQNVCLDFGCDLSGFLDAEGDGLIASNATLELDADNLAECNTAITDAYLIVFEIDDTSITDVGLDGVRWSEDGGTPQVCTTSPATVDGIVICPLCLPDVPADMAVQFDDVDVSNAVCVDTSAV